MAQLQIRCLGPFQTFLDQGVIVSFPSDKVRALLVYLAIEVGIAHRREALAALLWPDYAERQARQNLSQTLYALRQAIGVQLGQSLIDVTRQTICLARDEHCQVDALAMGHLCETCRRHTHSALEHCPTCGRHLSEAIALCDGPFMEGFSLPDSEPFDQWLMQQRAYYQRLFVEALHTLAAQALARGDHELGLEYARRCLDENPLDEQAHRQAMALLAAGGHRTAALAQFKTCCETLRRELDVDPEPQTVALYGRIRDGESSPAPPRGQAPFPLPVPLLPTVGRAADLAHLRQRLLDPTCRLLTVLAPGGTGKTHLSLEVARAEASAMADGVCHVPVENCRSISELVLAVARALAVPLVDQDAGAQGNTALRSILAYVASKEMLLVLDAFEGVVDSASIVGEMLAAAPRLKVMVTSRIKLGLLGEEVFRLRGLPWQGTGASGGAAGDAESLFFEAARRAQGRDQAGAMDREVVRDICRLVDGSPLAILLAAGWTPLMSEQQILGALEQADGSALDLLSQERAAAERHASMRKVFDLSWGLLAERLQRILAALSCFHGGFVSDAAKAVCGATDRDLRVLWDHSLIHRDKGERYSQHALLSEYGAERLAEMPAVAQEVEARYADYYAGRLAQWSRALGGPDQLAAVEALTADLGNVLQAWRRAAARGDGAWFERAGHGLPRYFWLFDRLAELTEVLGTAATAMEAALSAGRADESLGTKIAGRLRLWQAFGLSQRERLQEADETAATARAYLDRAERLGQDVRYERCIDFGVFCKVHRGLDVQVYNSRGSVCRRFCQEIGDLSLQATVLASWGWRIQQRDSQGPDLIDEGAALLRQAGDRLGLSRTLPLLAIALADHERFDEAQQALDQYGRARSGLGLGRGSVPDERLVGQVAERLGQLEQARRSLRRAIDVCQGYGLEGWLKWSHNDLAMVEMALGNYDVARAHAMKAIELGLLDNQPYQTLGMLELVKGDAAAAMAWQRAFCARVDAWSPSYALIMPMGVLPLGAWLGGQVQLARSFWALGRPRPQTQPLGYAWWLLVAALLALSEERTELAVAAWSAARRNPLTARTQFNIDIVGSRVEQAATALPPQAIAEAQAYGQSVDKWRLFDELLCHLSNPGDGDGDLAELIGQIMAIGDTSAS